MDKELKELSSTFSEKALLGSVLLYSEEHLVFKTVIDSGITVDDFCDVRNKVIFDCMLTLFNQNVTISNITVIERLIANHDIEKIGGKEYIDECMDSSISYEKTKEYINVIKKASLLRKLLKNCEKS